MLKKEDVDKVLKDAELDRRRIINDSIWYQSKHDEATTKALIYITANIDVLKYKYRDDTFFKVHQYIHITLKEKFHGYDIKVIDKFLRKNSVYSFFSTLILSIIFWVSLLIVSNILYLDSENPFSYSAPLAKNVLLTVLIALICFLITMLQMGIMSWAGFKTYITPKLDTLKKGD